MKHPLIASRASRAWACETVLFAFLMSFSISFEAVSADRGAAESGATGKPATSHCEAFGPRFFAVGENGLCAMTGAVVQVHSSKEFTNNDLYMYGQRIPTVFSRGAGVPMVYYTLEDVSKQTRYPSIGTISSAYLMLMGQSDLGLFRSFARVKIDANTYYDHNGNASFDLHKVDESYYLGALDEAWLQWNGLKVGMQPSMFGFNRLPSVVTPGYTSIVTTLGASYTHGVTQNMSVSIALEDPHRRHMGEGILARPSRGDAPDVVGMLRYATPSALFHLSGALHHAEDQVVQDFAGGSPSSVRGWAWSAGVESRVNWDHLLGSYGGGQLGRVAMTVAYTQGAIGYLGMPFFATDYVVGSDGSFHRSKGWSALVSYEHMLSRRTKLNLSASYFSATMQSAPEQLIPEIDPHMTPMPLMYFDVDVRGAVLQAGLEFMPMPNLTLGVESGYTITEAEGTYAGVQGEKERVGFPHVGVYVRRAF